MTRTGDFFRGRAAGLQWHCHKTAGPSVIVSDSLKFQGVDGPLRKAKAMNLYSTSVSLHVLAAILGLGPAVA